MNRSHLVVLISAPLKETASSTNLTIFLEINDNRTLKVQGQKTTERSGMKEMETTLARRIRRSLKKVQERIKESSMRVTVSINL